MQQEEMGGLTLKELMTLVLKDFKLVLALTLVGAIIGAAVAFANVATSYMSRTYTVSMDLAIIAQNQTGNYSAGRTEPSNEDITAARNSTTTAARIVEGDAVANAAIKKAGLIGVTATDISSKLTASAIKDSQILTVTFKWNDAEEAVEIMNAIAEVTPKVLVDTLKLGSATVIDSPKVVDAGAGMKKNMMMVLVGLLAGLFLGVAVVVLRDMFFPKLVDPFALRDAFGLKLLGAVPDDKGCQRHKRIAAPGELSPVSHQFHEAFMSSSHVLAHHLRSLRRKAEEEAAAQGAEMKQRARIIYVTSNVEQEGKSTCISRLGVNLAKDGWRTLLIDCDLRNPSLAPLFFDAEEQAEKVGDTHTVNAVMLKGVAPAEAVLQVRENLFLLPSTLEEERLELDYRVAEMCAGFANDYDVILIDTPPVGQVSDALALNQVADEAIFVVRYNYATYQMIQANLDVMKESGIPVLGAIANRVDTRFSELPRHYAKYSSRYSFGSGHSASRDHEVAFQRPEKKKPRLPKPFKSRK